MEGIVKFLRPLKNIEIEHGHRSRFGYGYGSGNGFGDGSGCGSVAGYGYGYGFGDGSGCGSVAGYGYGFGDGSERLDGEGGILSFNKQQVHIIDNVQTILKSVRGDIAKGFIIMSDLTLKPCYVVRNAYCYAHGDTLKEALKALEDKYVLMLPVEVRITEFKDKFSDKTKEYPNKDFYEWHYKLTGSCKTGRDAFCKNNSIDLNSTMTINEFIDLTINSYNGEIINQLKKAYHGNIKT